jgi:glutaminyl-peptide cyclotransferase
MQQYHRLRLSIIAILLTALAYTTAYSAVPTSTPPAKPIAAPIYRYRVVRSYPHDANAFTEGLVFDNGSFYEGTGVTGESDLRKVELETGKVVQQHRLADTYFGEGISILGDKIYQLTWQSQIGFVYDKATFKVLKSFTFAGQGWGLTNDGKRLILSNGTSTLTFLDPETFKKTGQIDVCDNGKAVRKLNELEYIDGEIYANVYETDWIARISPQTGKVTGWINLKGILDTGAINLYTDVLNGIAYDSVGKRLFVTGKYWPKLFEIELVPVSPQTPRK